MDRLERLVNLVAALLEAPRPLTRSEIRERVPGYPEDTIAYRRMFERDKESIRGMGIPLSVMAVDGREPEGTEGYRILREQYELADPGLHPEELAALHLAASAVQLGGVGSGIEALWKLGGGVGATAGPDPSVAIPGSDHLAVLFGAIAERRVVEFTYRGGDRRVDPHRLSFHNGRWYLAGYDHTRTDRRSFRLDRIASATVASGPPAAFERPVLEGAGLARPWELGDADPAVEALVLVDPGHADWAVGEVGPDAVCETRPDGSVVLRLTVRNVDAFRSFVLGFLDHAEVLGPPLLRDDMISWLSALVAG